MALQFQQPFQIQQAPTPLQALTAPIAQTLQTLPEQWDAYKHRRITQQIALQEAKSKYGTGAPPPLQAGVLNSAPPASAGPEEQMYGFDASMPTAAPETPEQQLERLGSEKYKALNQPDQVIPTYDASGKVTGFTPLPKGTKGFGGGKPPAASGANGTFKNEAELRKEFDKQSSDAKKAFESSTKALTLAAQNNAIGDTALAYALTRGALGSGGRVTQTEIQQFGPKLGSLSDKIQQGLLGLSSGQKFDDTTRQQIVDMVKQQAIDDSNNHTQIEDQYRQLAKDNGLQPGHVVHEIRPQTLLPYLKPQSQSDTGGLPSVGDMFQGHKVLSVKRIK